MWPNRLSGICEEVEEIIAIRIEFCGADPWHTKQLLGGLFLCAIWAMSLKQENRDIGVSPDRVAASG